MKNNTDKKSKLYQHSFWVTLILTMIIRVPLFAQDVTIPDANFKAALLGNALINTTDDGAISVAEAEAFTGTINVNDLSIQDLTGIEYFLNITSLTFNGNDILSLDLSNNNSLTFIQGYNNSNLSTFDISGATVLNSLNLSQNSLTAIDISDCIELSELYLAGNEISTIDISNNPDLTRLSIQANGLTSLDLTDAPLLRYLYAQENELASIDLTNNPLLINVFLGDNDLTSIDLSNNAAIEDLRIMENQIDDIDLTNNVSLEKVFVNDNLLTSFDIRNGNNEIITTFDITNNTSLDCASVSNVGYAVVNWTNVDDPSIFKLSCDPNEIINFPDVNFKAALLAHDPVIDINDDNEIQVSEAEAVTESLVVTAQGITDFTGLSYFVNITELDALGNDATTIDVSALVNLTRLKLYGNPLTELDIQYNVLLDFIQFGQTDLTSVDFTNNPLITYISAPYNNSMTSVDITGLNLLNYAYFQFNDLKSLDVSTNTHIAQLLVQGNDLSSLDLSNNTTISTIDVAGSINLISLDLSNNPNIASVDVEASGVISLDLSNQQYFRYLYASNSSLESLDLRNGNNTNINIFELSDNPSLTCVSVDSPAYSRENWTDVDDSEIFKLSCNPDDIINIPDINFKAVLLADAAINTTDDDEITVGEAEAFTGLLDANNSNISDVTGLKYFSNVDQIWLNGNAEVIMGTPGITTLDVSNNTKITTLNCAPCDLTSIDVSNNPDLINLGLRKNSISSLDISLNTALQELSLGENNLTILDISTNIDLRRLFINNNDITNIDLSTAPLLTRFQGSATLISELNLDANTALEHLEVVASLTSIDLSNNTLLKVVNISGNELTELDISNNTALTLLWATTNQLTSLDISQNTSINDFMMSNNLLSELNVANGNNSSFSRFEITGNPDLTCVTVDDVAYSTSNWTDIDAIANFSTDCSNVATDITAFSLTEETGSAVIDATAHTVDLEVAFGTDFTSLTPTFSISDGATADPESGAEQNFTSAVTYTVTAQNPNSIQAWIVSVSEENVEPTDIVLDINAISENNSTNDHVGSFSTTDGNDVDTHTYDLVSGTGDTDNASFNIAGNNLVAAEVFDFETKSSYTIRIQTTDDRGLTFQKEFSISIENIVSQIATISLDNLSFDENIVSNTAVATLSSTGDDLSGTFTYSLVSGTGDTDNSAFSIEGDQLKTVAAFDFETKSSYSVRIQSVEGAIVSAAAFTLSINNVNDMPTSISLTNNTIDENNTTSAVIGTLSTTDEDGSDTFTYSLVSGLGDADNESFNIAGNELMATEVFDFETKDSYTIRVETNDGEGGTFQSEFTITVNDVDETIPNNEPTAITLDNTSVDENNTVGDAVGSFSTTDADTGDSFTYTLVSGSGDTNNASFSISGSELLTAEMFDFETKDSYSVRVETNDGNGGIFQSEFTITVNDVDETIPNNVPTAITLDNTSIDENSDTGSEIGLFSTIDADIEDIFTYTLVSGAGDVDNASFAISAGVLVSAEAFDFEIKNTYSIRVETNDGNGGTFQTEFTITINDLDDDILNAIEDQLNIDIYPNPVSNLLKLSGSSTTGLHLSLINMHGKAVVSQSLLTNSKEIAVDHLKEGLYLLKLTGSNKSTTTKILIER